MPVENPVLKAIYDRRSIRKFKQQPLTDEQVQILADVALASPSGSNRQPWLFHFVRNQDVINTLSNAALQTYRDADDQVVIKRMETRNNKIFYGAPLVILISLPLTGESKIPDIDAGVAVAQLAIAAQAIGLSSCIIGLVRSAFTGPQGEKMAQLIGMPSDRRFAVSIAIGYPDTEKEAHDIRPDHIVWID